MKKLYFALMIVSVVALIGYVCYHGYVHFDEPITPRSKLSSAPIVIPLGIALMFFYYKWSNK